MDISAFATGTNFVHFGCWNRGFCNSDLDGELVETDNGITRVMKSLRKLRMNNMPKFAVIAGDNYYPRKYEYKTGEGVKKKNKIYSEANFQSGFECLKNVLPDIKKYILLGNHELDDIIKHTRQDINDIDSSESPFDDPKYKPETKKCFPLMKQLDFIQSGADNFNIFQNVSSIIPDDGANTIVIMIDTTMYEVIDNIAKNGLKYKSLQCYSLLDIGKNAGITIDGLEGSDNNNDDDSNKTANQAVRILLDKLVDNQRKSILDILNPVKDTITNVIFIGHHPIVSVRDKKTEVSPNLISEMYMNSEIREALSGKNIYHLCADTHFYQNGNIDINDGEMIIHQYIVGTGGAELDGIRDDVNGTPIKIAGGVGININYVIDDEPDNMQKSTHGYLIVNLDGNNVQFKFIDVGKPPSSTSSKKKDKSKKNKNKNKNAANTKNKNTLASSTSSVILSGGNSKTKYRKRTKKHKK
jgi:hypothetical protein